MYNTAISALGKARQVDAAEQLFQQVPAPDAVSYETLIAAYGMSGAAVKAEATFEAMRHAGGRAGLRSSCCRFQGHLCAPACISRS